ncbi:haloacid dehalogenase type II [Paraglaciecola sp.]|uniref:haloacid dehalogenase type II n=1 Tax=Paraglaciecola sp. TaxID=1920173 RepID=UPI0032677060
MTNLQANEKPKLIIFDVNETLLDLESMRTSVGKALNDDESLLPLWFSTMLHYSLVDTTRGEFHDFGKIGVAALQMVAKNNGIILTDEQAKQAIVPPLLSLPPHPDVREGLTLLTDAGYKIISLTNSSNTGVKAQFANANLTQFFVERLSVEDIGFYKPDLRSYEWALKEMGVKPEEVLMVAAHGWDIAGAKSAGLQTAFIARPNKQLYPLAPQPDYLVNDLLELVEELNNAYPE